MQILARPIAAALITAVTLTGMCTLAFYAGRLSRGLEAECPFELQEMQIAPQTPVAHKAPRPVPLPPRRPKWL